MPRVIRVGVPPLSAGEVEFSSELAHYLGRVHRLGAGDRFVAFDPENRVEADGEVLRVASHMIRCRIGPIRPAQLISPLNVTLIQSMVKGDKVDQVVRDATALGARRLIIVEALRSVAHLGNRAPARVNRWRNILVQSARQCGRGDLPELLGPMALGDALTVVAETTMRRLCLHQPVPCPLRTALAGWRQSEPLCALIGPEGGFSGEELELASGLGFELVSLGPFILRTETAATALLGALMAFSC